MKKKKIVLIMGIILTILMVILIGVMVSKKGGSGIFDKAQSQNEEISLDDNLTITAIESYNGSFVEDGSDEAVEDVLMITIENNGEQTLQYAEAQLVFDDVTAEFAFSTLRPGECMIVLEKNRMEYPRKDEVTEAQIQNVIYFTEELSFCEEQLELSVMDGAFNIKNISGEDLSGNIAIYYKNKQDDVYFGGITYRVVIEGGIEKDGIKQVMTNHFKIDESEVMFVDYTEME